MTQGVVVQITGGDAADWDAALRNLGNLVDAGIRPDEVTVVVHGDALPLLLDGSPAEASVAEMTEAGVSFNACANTIEGRGADEASLLDGVSVVASGVAEVVRLQRDGWAYLKLP